MANELVDKYVRIYFKYKITSYAVCQISTSGNCNADSGISS